MTVFKKPAVRTPEVVPPFDGLRATEYRVQILQRTIAVGTTQRGRGNLRAPRHGCRLRQAWSATLAGWGASSLTQATGATVSPHRDRESACILAVAIEKGQRADVGLDRIRHFSRHKQLATMLLYRDEVDQAATQARLAAIVADELTTAK